MLGTAKPVQEQKQGQNMVIFNYARSSYSIRIHQVGVFSPSYLVNKILSNGEILSWRFSSQSVAFKFAHFLGAPQKLINQNQHSLFKSKEVIK